MSKEAWKWILEEALTDHELVKLANESNIKPQGFTRQLSVDKTFSTMIRPKLLKTMQSRSMPKVLNTWNFRAKSDKKLKDFRGLTVEELQHEIKHGENLIDVLTSLLSCVEPDIQAKGDELFAILKESGQLAAFKEQKQKETEAQLEMQNEQKQLEEAKKQEELNHKKISNLEKTVEELRTANNKLKKELNEQRKHHELERTELEKELAEVKRQLLQVTPEKMQTKLEQKQAEWEKEQKALQQKLTQQESIVKKQKAEIERLDQRVRELESELTSYQLQEVAVAAGEEEETAGPVVSDNGKESIAGPRMKVALVATPKKANFDLVKSKRFQIEFVALERLEQALDAGELKDMEQVWYLTYETTVPQRRKLRGSVSSDRLKCFDTYMQAKNHIL